MPKQNTIRIAEAQRQRVNIKKKSEKYGPSTVYLQVLGSGTLGSPNTLYLFTDQKRYLFNCGESTQRLAHEHKVKLSRLNDIFITSKSWKNLGGLPGLSLTLQDVGVPNITLHGPKGLDELYNATKRFVTMKEMNVTMATCSTSEDFEDNAMSVKYVLFDKVSELLKEKTTKKVRQRTNPADHAYEDFIHDDTDYYSNEPGNGHLRIPSKVASPHRKDPRWHNQKNSNVTFHDKSNCHVAYICTLKKRLGTLDLAKCVELGVKPGPLLGQLKSGQDVCLHDGRIIRSCEVKTPDDPGPVFIVLELPDISYLKESRYFEAHFDNGKNPAEKIPSLIVHFTQPHVFNTPEYKEFMQKFGNTTQHLVVNDLSSCLGSEAVHRTQHKLHMLDSKIFPLLMDFSVPPVWDHVPLPPTATAEPPEKMRELDELKNRIALVQFQSIVLGSGSRTETNKFAEWERHGMKVASARTLSTFHLRPKKEFDRSLEPKLRIQEYICEPMDVKGFYASLTDFLKMVQDARGEDKQTVEFPRVLFVGTGSCIPSKTRNTSGIVIQMSEENSILLDCGEGTLCQLVRFFGPKKINSFLRSLKAAYISHLHADHHIGLIGVLQARRKAYEEIGPDQADANPLYLLAPGQIMSWLNLYDLQFEKIRKDFALVPNQGLMSDTSSAELTPAVLAAIGLRDVKTCLVSHCPNAFGVSLFLDPQYKITYSGDTIPNADLIELGRKSHLLIHEATMEDELADEARLKMHSTMSQAVEVGKAMEANYVILTHFSQRYARIPRLNPELLVNNDNVGIAFDNMLVSMQDLPLLSQMYKPLQLMFAGHFAEMEAKAIHRAHKKETGPSPKIKLPPSYRESHASRLRKQVLVGLDSPSSPSSRLSKTLPMARSHSVSPSLRSTLFSDLSQDSTRACQRNVHSLSNSPIRQRRLGITSAGASSRAATPLFAQPKWRWSGNVTSPNQSATRQYQSLADIKKKMDQYPPKRVPSPLKKNSFIIKKEEKPVKAYPKSSETKVQPRAVSARLPIKREPSIANASCRERLQSARKPIIAMRPNTAGKAMGAKPPNYSRPTTAPGPPSRQKYPLVKKTSSEDCCQIYQKTMPRNPEIPLPPATPTPSAQSTAIPSQACTTPSQALTTAVVRSSSTPSTAKPGSVPRLTSASSTRRKNVTLRSGLSKFTVPTTLDTKQSSLPKEPCVNNPICKQIVEKSSVDKIVSSVSKYGYEENGANKEMLDFVCQLPACISTASFVIETQDNDVQFTRIDNTIMVMTMKQTTVGQHKNGDHDEYVEHNPKTIELTSSEISTSDKDYVEIETADSDKSLLKRASTPIYDAVNNSVVTNTLNMSSTTRYQKKNLSHHRPSFNNGKFYKPQLADIQSSCFLLKKPEAAVCRKPLLIDEEAVRQRLLEAKRKFSSREYCHESKYDKIEGLNWISWK